MAWEGSSRHSRLPAGWSAMARQVIREEPFCRCPGCRRCTPGVTPCTRESTDVDHIVRGDNHERRNLQGLCNPCHRAKSSREGNDARRQRRAAPRERHPGLLN